MKISISILFLALAALPASAQPPPPTGFSAFGGAVAVGASKGAPEPMVGYPLASWPTLLRPLMGEGSIVGLAGKNGLALGIGHRFVDYRTPFGEVVNVTIGPAWFVPFAATRGLRSGELRLFVSVGIVPRRAGT